MKIQTLIDDLGATKAGIARKIGVPQMYVYMWLNPPAYPKSLPEWALQKIAAFEGRSLKSVRADYASRRTVAA